MLKIQCDNSIKNQIADFVEKNISSAQLTTDADCDICVFSEEINHNFNSDSIIIANGDNHELIKALCECENVVITCGLSQICTITVSSIEEDNIVLCIQRIVNDVNGKQIVPQEIPVKKLKAPEISGEVLVYALALICGEKTDKLEAEGR